MFRIKLNKKFITYKVNDKYKPSILYEPEIIFIPSLIIIINSKFIHCCRIVDKNCSSANSPVAVDNIS